MSNKRLTKEQWNEIKKLFNDNSISRRQIARQYRISPNSLYVHARKNNWLKKSLLTRIREFFK